MQRRPIASRPTRPPAGDDRRAGRCSGGRADAANWAKPVDRLSAAGVTGASDDAVSGKRVTGPLVGFGQLWQKTFTVRLDGVDITPEALVAHWKQAFPTFWPKGNRFWAPMSGIAPGEVGLLELSPLPGAPVRLSTGVLVIYADAESFTFMTPEGHTLSAWITFSARRDGDVTVAQAQALERPADPFDELAYLLGGNGQNNKFWEATLRNLAASVGVGPPSSRPRWCSSMASANGATGATSAPAPRCGPPVGR